MTSPVPMCLNSAFVDCVDESMPMTRAISSKLEGLGGYMLTWAWPQRYLRDVGDPDDTATELLRRVLLGLHPEVSTDGVTGSARFEPLPEHQGAPGWVHGGFLATVLDHFCARIARAALDGRVATGTLDLRYRQPVLLDGGPYVLDGTAEAPRGRTVHVHAVVLGPDGRVRTEAKGLFVRVQR